MQWGKRCSRLGDKTVEFNQSGATRKKCKRVQVADGMRRHQQDQDIYYACPRRKRGKGTERFFNEIMAENFPNLR